VVPGFDTCGPEVSPPPQLPTVRLGLPFLTCMKSTGDCNLTSRQFSNNNRYSSALSIPLFLQFLLFLVLLDGFNSTHTSKFPPIMTNIHLSYSAPIGSDSDEETVRCIAVKRRTYKVFARILVFSFHILLSYIERLSRRLISYFRYSKRRPHILFAGERYI
jgi:hypothetical protein